MLNVRDQHAMHAIARQNINNERCMRKRVQNMFNCHANAMNVYVYVMLCRYYYYYKLCVHITSRACVKKN